MGEINKHKWMLNTQEIIILHSKQYFEGVLSYR